MLGFELALTLSNSCACQRHGVCPAICMGYDQVECLMNELQGSLSWLCPADS